MNMNSKKHLYSVSEVIELTGFSRSTVQRLIRSGKIQASPVNAPQNEKIKPLRVPAKELSEFFFGDTRLID